MHCGISGEICEEPVLAKGSGTVYEKRVIMKYLEGEGKDPATGEPLTEDDLIPVKASKVVRPRPTQATSIPALVALFQNEWDALMVETYTLKQHLSHTRKELTQALYQHDAACRVIARLAKERDEARLMLNALQSQIAQRQVAAAMDVDQPEANGSGPASVNDAAGMGEAVLGAINATCEALSKTRKKRPIPEGLPRPDQLAAWGVKDDVAPHQASKPGVLAIDVANYDQNLIVSGGNDKDAVVYNRKTAQVVSKLKGHSKKVNAVLFHPQADANGLVITGSADRTVRLWTRSGDKYNKDAAVISAVHGDEVTGLAMHATNAYFASSSKDKSWAFYDVSSGQLLVHVRDPSVTGSLECLCFHPDGVLLATGTGQRNVRIWDMKTQANVATFADHTDAVKSVAFSENGYVMASGSADGTVRLWDLRKLKCTSTLEVGDAVHSVTFDSSAQYLAVGGKGVKVYTAKDLSVAAEYNDHGDTVTALKWGFPASAFLASASLDRTIKIYQ